MTQGALFAARVPDDSLEIADLSYQGTCLHPGSGSVRILGRNTAGRWIAERMPDGWTPQKRSAHLADAAACAEMERRIVLRKRPG